MEISPKRLVAGLFLIFALGIMFAIVNGEYTESYGQSLPVIVYGVSFVSIVLGSTIVLMFQWKISAIQMQRVLKVLPKDERTIVSILFDNNNRIEQNYLVVLSGMNKVRISRVLKKLEERQVVEKKKIGNTNMVILVV
ncbi:MAG: hypothetical protein KAJ91_05210 [Candidatus Aenigmarchaeota archaeon]|nr:hypothetical protein [Candidatus Aenigmarchaeota archaeon]